MTGAPARSATRAAIYTRVSTDLSGRGRSPAEQEQQARTDAERLGWTISAVYSDLDRGASRYSGVTRPEFERLRADITAGLLDVLIVWEASRLQRDLKVYVELRDLCREHGVLWSYNGRTYDLADSDDQFNTGMDALLAEREAAYISKRTRRAMAANASSGRAHGAVMFGFRREYDALGALVRQLPDPATAPIVEEMFRRCADGEALHAIARSLNERGLRLPRAGIPWSGGRIAVQLKNRAAYLGHRVHHGKVTVPNAWPALVDEVTYYRAQAVLAAPGRRQGGGYLARYLASGLMACGVCGEKVTAGKTGKRKVLTYICRGRACVGRGIVRIDAKLAELIVERLSRPDALVAFTAVPSDDTASVAAQLAETRLQLAEVERAVAALEMPAAMGGRIAMQLTEHAEQLERTLTASAARPLPQAVIELTRGDTRARWDAMALESRRDVVRALLDDLTVHRVGADYNKRLGISFRWYGEDVVQTF